MRRSGPQDAREEVALEHVRRKHAVARLVGRDPAFVAVVERLPAISAGDATVLISGETGTGKELFARAIHYLSARAAFPFIPVNCGAIADSLLEDELFGHERGAFTDARLRRTGLFEQAHRGTLFLDEVSSLGERAQVALLRVLEDRTFRPLGSSSERRIDVRYVAATNVPLNRLVERGTIRADLYYRLNVLTVHLPPLRERVGDILPLAEHFLSKHGHRDGRIPQLSPAVEARLLAHDWPGNVRELKNAIIRGISLAEGEDIEPADLGLPGAVAEGFGSAETGESDFFQDRKRRVIAAFEHDYLLRLMARHRGNVTRAARAAGKERRELGKLLKRHDVNPRDFVGGSEVV